MSVGRERDLRLLLDEDLSPKVAQRLREEDGVDAIHLRDIGKLGRTDRQVLRIAFEADRILVTANVRDFRKLARAAELHPGIVLMLDGDLIREEQLREARRAIAAIRQEAGRGRDMVNRLMHIEVGQPVRIEVLP